MFYIALLSVVVSAQTNPAKGRSAYLDYELSVRDRLAQKTRGGENQPKLEENVSSVSDVPDYLKLEQKWQTGPNCGPLSLFYLLNLNGIHASKGDLIQASAPDPQHGTTLAGLQAVAGAYGFSMSVVKTVPDQIEALPTPFIIHWDGPDSNAPGDGDHFDVILAASRSGGVFLIDSTNSLLVHYPPEKFSSLATRMSGYALITREWRVMDSLLLAGCLVMATSCSCLFLIAAWRKFTSNKSVPT